MNDYYLHYLPAFHMSWLLQKSFHLIFCYIAHFKSYNWRSNGQLTECAVIDRRTGNLEVDNCESKGKGYVCRTKCNLCPISVTSYSCLKENGGCYIIGCDAGNWFGARNLCRNMNGYLEFVESTDSAEQIRQAIGTLGIRSCDSFWLGVRHSDWFIDKRGTRKPILYRSFWYDDQPESDPGKRCAVLQSFYKGYYLCSSGCDQKYPFACQKVPSETTLYTTEHSHNSARDYVTTEADTVTASVHSGSCKCPLALITSFSVVIVILSACLGILLYLYRSKQAYVSLQSKLTVQGPEGENAVNEGL